MKVDYKEIKSGDAESSPFIIIKGSRITYRFVTQIDDKPTNGFFNARIPAFGINYSAKDKDEAIVLGAIMVDSFFYYWINKEKRKDFIKRLLELGFVAEQRRDFVLKQLLNFKKVNAKLKYNIPLDETISESSNLISQEKELEIV